MTWYYVQQGERKGPVDESVFASLVQDGTIRADTLVWREGMENWDAYGTVAGPAQTVPTAAPLSVPAIGLAQASCSRCGQNFPADQMVHLGGSAVCARCKPIVLQSMQEGASTDNGAEQIRQAHLSHETNVKSIGLLYFFGGTMLALSGLMLGIVPASSRNTTMMGPAVIMLMLLVMAGLMLATGAGLRKLRPWARIVSGVLAGIGLLGFPLGTLINGFILYLLFSKKGAVVFSEPYQRVIAATPHITSRTSIIVWILVGLLLLLIGFAMVGALLSRH